MERRGVRAKPKKVGRPARFRQDAPAFQTTTMSDLPPPPPPARKKHGCFFYGCLTLVILAILAGVATFFAVRYVLHRVTALIEQYTEPAATALPPVAVSAADYEKLKARL